ncbi:hypothetical protein DWV16_11270 [Anaerotruncus sp. AF02-27]|nr:hypothetical protein DWV16_11270 [Anaerotruncus sp. AF02-27]
MRKRRIGTAKFFTLLLLLYHTSAKAAGFFSRHGRYRNLKSIEMFLYEKPFDKTQRVGRIFSELFVACPVGKVMK